MNSVKWVFFIVKYLLVLSCLGDQISQNNKFLDCFITYLNTAPNVRYKYEDASLLNFYETEHQSYKIEVQLKARDIRNQDDVHLLRCIANLAGQDDCPAIVEHSCQEQPTSDTSQEVEEVFKQQTIEPATIENDIVHDADNQEPSDIVREDEVVAKPVARPGTPCVGCSTHVNPQASGVDQLAALGIRHLDVHDHNAKHTLDTVVDVERQVQVVNGVRYVLTLVVDFDSCSLSQTDPCIITKVCKITILEKPWKKLSDGSKYRSILSNNCTEEWLFGDEGEVLILNPTTNTENNEITHNSDFVNIIPGEQIFTEHNSYLQSEPQYGKTLSDDQIKTLEIQIIPNSQVKNSYDVSQKDAVSDDTENTIVTIEPQSSVMDGKFDINNSNKATSSLNNDKKKAIDDLMIFLNYAPFHPYTGANIKRERIKRSDDYQVPLDDLFKTRNFTNLVGGEHIVDLNANKEQDVQNSKYFNLLEQSSQKYHVDSHLPKYYKVVELSKVTTQVVAGTLTKLYYKMAETNCEVNEKGQASSSECQVVKKSKILCCKSQIWEKSWIDFIQYNVTCDDCNSRSKRQILGGENEKDPNNPTYRKLARESLSQFYQTSGGRANYQIVKIDKVTEQVVAGLTKIDFTIASTNCTNNQTDILNCKVSKDADFKNCQLEAWEKAWLKKKEMKVTCGNIRKTRTKRELGGISELDRKDPRFWSIARKSIHKYLSTSGIKQYHDVVEMSRVTTQVVAGRETVIDFKVAPTNCDTTVNVTLASSMCKVDENSKIYNCQIKIWEKPWMHQIVKNVTCDGDLELLHNFVQASLVKLESLSTNKYRMKILKINDFATKNASGRLTTISFDVGFTSCLKFESVADINDCKLLSNMPTRRCVSTIWERIWLDIDKNIGVTCQDKGMLTLVNNSLENTTAAVYLANLALKSIEAKYPHPKKQKIVKIFSVQNQIVAGDHYRLKIEVGYTNCTALSVKGYCKLVHNAGSNKFCRVNIWLRPWTDHPPNIHVSCDYPQNFTADLYQHLQAEQLFNEFLSTYRPDYKNDVVQTGHRFQIFKENVKKIHELNIHEQGTAKYGITRFSDLTYNEFKAKYTGLKQNKRDHNQIPTKKASIPVVDLPQSYDWRDQGAVTEVKDQGSCGSCWAFSVTGNIEGQWKIKSGKLVSLSEQELVDCDKLDDGCQGGLPDNAYRALESMGGLMSEQDYPYDGEKEKCVFNKTLARVQVHSAVNISSNETKMAQWLVGNGPISIGINANAMQFYMGGISHPWKMLCNPDNLDHGVLIVGYGEKNYPLFQKRLPYWIVKNSWGKGWGEQGYYRVFRGDGTCGVNMMASSAIV